MLAVIACSGPQTNTQQQEHVHASCFELVMGQGTTLSLSAVNTADVRNPTPSPEPPRHTRLWSDASSWPDRTLPAEGDNVLIPVNDVVLLDVSTPELGKLTIAGSLVVKDNGATGGSIELTAAAIEIYGGMYVGSESSPYRGRAIITVGNEDPRYTSNCFSQNYIGLVHGKLELYGDDTGRAWTRLSSTAPAGATSITVDDAGGWKAGDVIAIASTDYYLPYWDRPEPLDRRLEVRTLTRVDGNRLEFADGLTYEHFGETQRFGNQAQFPTTTLESRAEVMRLTRNVTVRGPEASSDPSNGAAYRQGAHIKALGNSRVRLDSIELTAMGRYNELMRYPVHFHLQGEAAFGSFVRNSSLHSLYNRCITIHGSSGILLKDNAAFDTYGHCYFFEDGAETRNVLDGNLGMGVRRPAEGYRLIPTDGSHQGPSVFWVTNPDNVLVNNVAASSAGSGFWYSLPEQPTGPSAAIFASANIRPRLTPLGEFDRNLAHSNNNDGLHVDRGPAQGSLEPETASYRPRSNPTDRASEPVTAYFDNFVAYKHRNAAAWFRGDFTELRGGLLADNSIGATFASNDSGMTRTVVVEQSANIGAPDSNNARYADGRPRVRGNDFAIRGFEFYDGTVYVKDSYFEGFVPASDRPAGALSILNHTSFSLSPSNHAQGLTFSSGANRVRFETRTLDQRQADYVSRDSGSDGFSSGAFIDIDGSVTGNAGAYVTVRNPLLDQSGCSVQSAWNALVCQTANRYVSLSLRHESTTQIGPVQIARGAVGSSTVHTMFGTPHGGTSTPNLHFRTTVPLGHEYHYQLNSPAPARLTLELREVQVGDSLLVSLPYSGAAPTIYRDWWIDPRNTLPRYQSLADLKANETGFYQSDDRLYLKLTVQASRDYAHLTVCRKAGC